MKQKMRDIVICQRALKKSGRKTRAMYVAIRLRAGHVNQGSIPGRSKSSVLSDARIGSQTHQDSHLIGTGFYVPSGKAVALCVSVLTAIYCRSVDGQSHASPHGGLDAISVQSTWDL